MKIYGLLFKNNAYQVPTYNFTFFFSIDRRSLWWIYPTWKCCGGRWEFRCTFREKQHVNNKKQQHQKTRRSKNNNNMLYSGWKPVCLPCQLFSKTFSIASRRWNYQKTQYQITKEKTQVIILEKTPKKIFINDWPKNAKEDTKRKLKIAHFF